jgi:hypothetical protein
MHMHTLYNSTGPGTYKIDALTGYAVMLPGGAPPSPFNFQVSTLEIGGTLWLVGGLDLISGAMTSPGGIVRLLPNTKVKIGAAGNEAITVTDIAGGAYYHTIVRNLVIGSSTVTIKKAVTFKAVTTTESASYGSFTMNSTALGLGSTGGSLVINAPGEIVTIDSLDGTGLGTLKVIAGTLAIQNAGGLTNLAPAKITISGGAQITIAGVGYTP